MKIEHIAIWTSDLEKMKDFYTKFFHLQSNEKYSNPKKRFSSYFLAFQQGTRIELMHNPIFSKQMNHQESKLGFAHFAISVGSKQKVDALTQRIREEGHTVVGEPRRTGDGYYESVIADPEGNLIEITE